MNEESVSESTTYYRVVHHHHYSLIKKLLEQYTDISGWVMDVKQTNKQTKINK